MIDDGAIERRGKRRESPSVRPVSGAGCDMHSLLTVSEHDSGALMSHGIGNDFAYGKRLAGLAAAVAAKMEALSLSIDMRDPKGLARRILLRHAPGKEGSRGFEAVELQREFGTLVPHDEGLGAMALRTCILFDPNCPTIVKMDHSHP